MKNLLFVICGCFLLSSCYAAQLGLGAIDIIAKATKSTDSDQCKGKSTFWDPGYKHYYCYDLESTEFLICFGVLKAS